MLVNLSNYHNANIRASFTKEIDMADYDEKAHGLKDQKNNQTLGNKEETKDGNETMPPGRSDLALKRFENREEKPEEQREHTLQEHAKERAKHPETLNAGTPFDWEDLEDYKKELERLDEYPPKSSETP